MAYGGQIGSALFRLNTIDEDFAEATNAPWQT